MPYQLARDRLTGSGLVGGLSGCSKTPNHRGTPAHWDSVQFSQWGRVARPGALVLIRAWNLSTCEPIGERAARILGLSMD